MQLRVQLLGDDTLQLTEGTIGSRRGRITVEADEEEQKAGDRPGKTPSPPEPTAGAWGRGGCHGDG
jgi:hypothetical protein